MTEENVDEFLVGYTSDILDDAQAYADHAMRAGRVEVADVEAAVQGRSGWEFGEGAPKDVSLRGDERKRGTRKEGHERSEETIRRAERESVSFERSVGRRDYLSVARWRRRLDRVERAFPSEARISLSSAA
jgi:hypothetical protein